MKKTVTIAIALTVLVFNEISAEVYSVGLDKSQFTSDFAIGKVVVSIIFPESDGTGDPKTESWSEDRKTLAVSKIMAGLQWWPKQNPKSPLSFTFVSQTVSTRYEPITHPYYDEALWITDIMGKLGYSGSRFTATRTYVNDLRTKYKTDWGFVIFVVDSLADTDGKFADGYFAYTYLGGPYTVMTYDNNGYGIGNMDVVVAHETGHIFHALDEYAGASSPNDYSSGYFPTINGNHVYSTIANDPDSIMRGGIRWGFDDWARIMVGWRDADKNGRDDILDASPAITLSPQSAGAGSNSFTGRAIVGVTPRQGSDTGAGMNVDTIAKVEYRLKSGEWAQAAPTDGAFDSAQENFIITLASATSAQSIKSQDIELRAVTSLELSSSGGGSSGPTTVVPAPSDLDGAHAFPNPFKPNSALGHTDVTFTGLTGGAKVQIFTQAGEPVFDQAIPTSATTLKWTGINASGQTVASGVYYYLITDASGHTKKGKIAVIR